MPTLPLKSIPKDVNDYILQIQLQVKIDKRVSQYSKCLTIYKIIREHKELMSKTKI
jgi:hypothetical protein